MEEKENPLQASITGGIVGAALGAIVSDDKEEGAVIGAIIGAALGALVNANKEAKKSDVPLLEVQNGVLYKIYPGGKKEFVRNIEPTERNYPKTFKLR